MGKWYRTRSGDTWDLIAKEVYGDESGTSFLMANNQEYLRYFIFPEGVSLKVEEMPEDETMLPNWRR